MTAPDMRSSWESIEEGEDGQIHVTKVDGEGPTFENIDDLIEFRLALSDSKPNAPLIDDYLNDHPVLTAPQ